MWWDIRAERAYLRQRPPQQCQQVVLASMTLWVREETLASHNLLMDSIASFTKETGGQRCHVMWILTNQQAAW